MLQPRLARPTVGPRLLETLALRCRSGCRLILVMAITMVTTSAHAVTMLQFTGSVTDGSDSLPFSGSLEYDASAAPTSNTPTSADFGGLSATFDFSGFVFESDANATVFDDGMPAGGPGTVDGISIFGTAAAQLDPAIELDFQVDLLSSDLGVFNSTMLPMVIALGDFDTNEVTGVLNLAPDTELTGALTSLNVVPLPAPAILLLSGLAGLGVLRARGRSNTATR